MVCCGRRSCFGQNRLFLSS